VNLQKKLRFGLFALAIALVAAAVPASAQQLYKATFDLPFEAQWGKTVVEPGQYTIVVEEALGQKLIRLRGATQLAMFAIPSSYPEPVGDTGRLTFVSVDGLYTLKSFSIAAIGKSFYFPVPKSKGGEHAEIATLKLGIN
jgi:hypothetical protein